MITAFGAAFLLVGLVQVSLLWYHPLAHRWTFEARPSGLAMDFYGRLLYASIASGIAFAMGRWLGDRTGAALSRRQASFALVAGLAVMVLAIFVIVSQVSSRLPQPLPFPPSYDAQ